MLEISTNQIYSETYKALRSVNIDWGVAKDSANLCKWLAVHNQFFLGSILQTADLYKHGEICISLNNNTSKKPLSAALMGLTLVEYVAATKQGWEGYLNKPKFLIAAMALISNEQNIYLKLSDKNQDIIALTNNKKIYVNFQNFKNSNQYFYLELCKQNVSHNVSQLDLSIKSFVSKVNEKCWEKLKSMAFDTYVPESHSSKSGAGY